MIERNMEKHHADEELNKLFPRRGIHRILLISPPDVHVKVFNYDAAKRCRCMNYPPYGLGIIASHLRDSGLSVEILNLNNAILDACRNSKTEDDFDFENIWKSVLEQAITSFIPDIIGITCMFSMSHESTVNLCNYIKDLDTTLPMALGGVHITNCMTNNTMSKQLLEDFSNVDFFFVYEAELAFKQFIRIVNKEIPLSDLAQVYFNSKPERLYFSLSNIPSEKDLDIIPAHDLITLDKLAANGAIGAFFCLKNKETKFTTIISNRGCRGRCAFCNVRNFNGLGVRHRSVESIIEELILLRDRFGIGHVMWLDDDLLHDNKRAIRLFNEMIKQNIGITWDCTNGVVAASCTDEVIAAAAESGCIGLNIGVESGNEQMLKISKKPGNINTFIKAAKVFKKYEQINARVFLIIGFPDETYRMILDTLNLAREMDLDWYNINIYQPIPNTAMFDYMVQRGLLDQVGFENIRFSGGPYGQVLQNVNKGQLDTTVKNVFENINLDTIPTPSQLYNIWFFMNYHLNFKRLYKENRPVKLIQKFKYVQNITDRVAPNDPFAMYFCGYMQNKILGSVDNRLIKRLETRLNSSGYWEERFEEFDLSVSHLKTGNFPSENEE